MDSNSNYSQFIEHSFRRLTLLIHQQDVLDSSTSANKTTEHSFNISSSLKTKKNNELELFSLKNESHRQLNGDNPNGSIKTEVKSEPISRTRRTYMRPPKNRTTSKVLFQYLVYFRSFIFQLYVVLHHHSILID
jgi:hypothetical protein